MHQECLFAGWSVFQRSKPEGAYRYRCYAEVPVPVQWQPSVDDWFSGKPVFFCLDYKCTTFSRNVRCSLYPSSVRYQWEVITITYDFSIVADPGSGAILTPGSGPRMNNPDHISESLETIFRVKIFKFFEAYPDSGSRIFWLWNRDPGWKKLDPGSGINIPDPQNWILARSERDFVSVWALLTRQRFVGTPDMTVLFSRLIVQHVYKVDHPAEA